jgi:hypothetical protein
MDNDRIQQLAHGEGSQVESPWLSCIMNSLPFEACRVRWLVACLGFELNPRGARSLVAHAADTEGLLHNRQVPFVDHGSGFWLGE